MLTPEDMREIRMMNAWECPYCAEKDAEIARLKDKLAGMCREHEYLDGYCCHCGDHKPAPGEAHGEK